MTADGKTLWVTSMYGMKGRAPLVVITVPGGETMQMSPEEARQHAQQVIECAEAAEQDGFMFEFAKTNLKVSDEIAAQLINEFRKWRKARER